MAIENEHFNCKMMVSCKVTTIANDDKRNLGCRGVGGHYGGDRGVMVSGVYWGLTGTVGTLHQKGYRCIGGS